MVALKLVEVAPMSPLLRGAKKSIERRFSSLRVSEGHIELPATVNVSGGVFKAVSTVLFGSKGSGAGNPFIPTSAGWLFNTSRSFAPGELISSNELPLTGAPYRIELEPSGAGFLELPGYRFGDGTLVLYTTPSYNLKVSPESLEVWNGSDHASLHLTPTSNGILGEVDLELTRAEYAEVSIAGRMVRDIAFLESSPGRFEYRFPAERIIVVSHEKVLSPKGLQKALGGFIGVAGHGPFTVTLGVGKESGKAFISSALGGNQRQ
ncbi:hypothetical protein [Thermococcus sp.]|uniref:hypothetical protein n=1 Tax=Thermococcus sp. TaxID=35749 RepID=UPI002619F1EE|nr:hypothetical protein [Thermococcus sp.]